MIVIAGPCVIESRDLTLEIANSLKAQLAGLPLQFFFKASFDKANRSSLSSFRGPGLKEGLKILAEVRDKVGVPTVTDFHEPNQAMAVAEVVDVLQIPAFLCRQTDVILEGARAAERFGRHLNVKKGQFIAPEATAQIVAKVREVTSRDCLWLTERGASFGYNNLVVDMSGIPIMKSYGPKVIFDATHSVQTPGVSGLAGGVTGGARSKIEPLARAAMAAGSDGVFLECHPRPREAKSDAGNAFLLESVGSFIKQLLEIKQLIQTMPLTLPAEYRT